MASNKCYVEVVITNGKCVKAIRDINRLSEELKESYPWSDEVKELCRAARSLSRELKTQRYIESKKA